MKYYFTILIIVFQIIVSFGQQIPVTEAQVRAELAKRGLSETEVRATLAKEGIDADNLQNLSPSDIAKLQDIIERLESEKKAAPSTSNETSGSLPVEIDDNIPQELPIVTVVENQEEKKHDTKAETNTSPHSIYGHNIFKDGNIQVFKQSNEIKPPETYILGAGDEVTISIFGISQIEEKYEVRPDGYIRILDGRQRVLMKGLNISQAKDKLYKIYSNYYRFNSGEFELTLNYSRTVKIGIYGEVSNPGSLTISALNSAFNALVAINGPTDIGSVRKIRLIKSDGESRFLDVYEYMSNPNIAKEYYLEDNDNIFVPVQGKVVTITGAVKRPMMFELLPDEKLNDALKFAGGFKQNAFKKNIQIRRYIDDEQIILDVDYEKLVSSNGDYMLNDGDEILIRAINQDASNVVFIEGEVVNPGGYQKSASMKLLDLINIGGLKPESRTDLAYLQILNPDGTISATMVDIGEIVANPSSATNLPLSNGDKLIVWSKSRYADSKTIRIDGAVRAPGEFAYAVNQKIRVSDAIILAGGTTRDADDIGFIHRKDPLIPTKIEYIKIDISQAIKNENSDQNLVLQAFDRLEVISKNTFHEEYHITVDGAVNLPGEYQYGVGMTLREALLLARGFKLSASPGHIEISRIIISDNQPTKTIVANLNVNRDFLNEVGGDADFKLQPYDNIIVRFAPDFELQQNVEIIGEIKFPGVYPILNDNEKISSLIRRGGGISKEAFVEGAKLYRNLNDVGYVVMRLDEVLDDVNSKYNYILKAGDRIEIPKHKEFVTIEGATKAREVLQDDILGQNNSIKVAFHKGKDALFYINYYAGGLDDDGRKSKIFVEHPNGEIKRTKKVLFWYQYPEVKKGSVIKVGREEPKPIALGEKEKEDIDWTKVLGDSVAQAMSILTLILLIQRLD